MRRCLRQRRGFPGSSDGKEFTCSAGDLGPIPGLGRSPGEGNSYPLQYSGLENSMDSIVHGVAKSQTQLSDFHFASCATRSLQSYQGNCMCPHEIGTSLVV